MLGSNTKEEQDLDKKSKEKKDASNEDASTAKVSSRAAVKVWTDRIRSAKEFWKNDFDRMRSNMDFVAGIQHLDQTKIMDPECRYIINLVLRAVNQGTAMLYAKDPKVSIKRKPRLDFKLWDGKIETIQQAMSIMQLASQAAAQGLQLPVPPDIQALMVDFQQGRLHQQTTDKVSKTLELTCQHVLDDQQPSFKTQMKQLVRRVNVSGVGWVKVNYCREYENELTQSTTRVSPMDRAKLAKGLLEKLEKGDIDEESAEVTQLKALVASLGSEPLDHENTGLKERITYDFPQATSIILDPCTRILKGLVGCHWQVEEFYYPLDFIKDFYELRDLKMGGDLKTFAPGKTEDGAGPDGETTPKNRNVRVWELTSLDNKSRCVLIDGYQDFAKEWEPVSPSTKNSWNLVPVTFNDVEVEAGCKATVYPPSVIDLMRSAQIQWNEVRNKLARHREANGPKYMYADGSISDEDLDRLMNAVDQQFVKIKGSMPGADLTKIVAPLQVAQIQAETYDTAPLQQDILLGTGAQEANLGPAQPNVTATVGTIAEQSRMSVAASDIDGLDDSLTEIIQCTAEIILMEFAPETVMQIVGMGGTFPDQNRAQYLSGLEIGILAASSGRPNKAVEINNWERISQVLVQAGANPQAIIRQSLKVLDSDIDPVEFFPLPGAAAIPGQQQPQQPGKPSGVQQKNPGQPAPPTGAKPQQQE